jgi:hypothetical protein
MSQLLLCHGSCLVQISQRCCALVDTSIRNGGCLLYCCCCCSQLVEKIMDCSRAGKLQEVVAEKRSVLTSMQQVLQSCYALLDSTQVPLHSIIRLLQHILRCGGRVCTIPISRATLAAEQQQW